jgi:hypothetical protein
VKLSHTRHGDKGEIRVRLMFTPEVIYKTRQKTSTFSTAGRAMTQIGGMPVGVGKGVVGGVGKVFRRDKQNQSIDSTLDSPTEPPAGQTSQPIGADGTQTPPTGSALFPSASKVTLDAPNNEPGTLRLTIIDAKDISDEGDPVKPYVILRVGDKEQKTKHVGKTTQPEW